MKKTIDYHIHQIENLISKARKFGKRSIIYEADVATIGESVAETLVRRLNDENEGALRASVVDLQEGLIAVEW